MSITYTELKNGIQVIVKEDKRLRNSVVNIFLKVGSAAESSTKTGLAHFTEHMMFEGSQNYPFFDIELQKLQAENNAFTGQDYTNYYELAPKEHIPKDIEDRTR